jgi:hypothetical protein
MNGVSCLVAGSLIWFRLGLEKTYIIMWVPASLAGKVSWLCTRGLGIYLNPVNTRNGMSKVVDYYPKSVAQELDQETNMKA